MGILEIHFHDSEFEWTVGTDGGTDRADGRSFSLGGVRKRRRAGKRGGDERSRDPAETPSPASKLKSVAFLALLVGSGVAYNRLQARRDRKRAEAESSGRRLPLIGSK